MADPKSEPDSATERFKASFLAAKPATGGVTLDDLAAEIAPLLPLLIELSAEKRAGENFDSFDFRECFTVLTLIGRRLALLDLTPSSAIRIVRLALACVSQTGDRRSEAFEQQAVAAAVEGFMLGREERVAQLAETGAAALLRPLRIDPSIFALIISGVHEPTVLSDCVDALGRAMLDADVERAIVDLSQLGEANAERAIALFAADEVAKMLGGCCFFSGIDARWRAAAADAGIALDAMQIAPTLDEALASARNSGNQSGEDRNSSWRTLLDRLLG